SHDSLASVSAPAQIEQALTDVTDSFPQFFGGVLVNFDASKGYVILTYPFGMYFFCVALSRAHAPLGALLRHYRAYGRIAGAYSASLVDGQPVSNGHQLISSYCRYPSI